MTRHGGYIDRLFTNPAWMRDAPCIGHTDKFYPDRGDPDGGGEAKAICRECPHRVRCLEYAIDNKEEHGIWGGMSRRQRQRIARDRRAMGWTTGVNRGVQREDVA